MSTPRTVLCGGVNPPGIQDDTRVIRLDVSGPNTNVSLKISDISEAMIQNVPDILVDLLEVAAYVYSADQAVSRGGLWDTGKRWRRDFHFHIPVRCPTSWSRSEVNQALVDVLSFLSDDDYEFTFTKLTQPQPIQLYFEGFASLISAEEVLLFSGGLDSLAGAVQATIAGQRQVALVSHRSAPKLIPGVAYLVEKLTCRATKRIHHVPVWATKSGGREYTQRTRSFLYASLATTIAQMFGLNGISFYENGVTSINLPIAEQVVGARATRTTHPQSLNGFAKLFSLLLEQTFTVGSPFLWMTKGEIIQLIRDNGCVDLIRHTMSCSRTVEATTLHTHCGRCSQCIERRFATLAAGLSDEEDPAEMYKVQLMTDERPFGETRTMAESFLRRVMDLRQIDEQSFFKIYPEVSRVLHHVKLKVDDAATRILDLHRRHGGEVQAALTEGYRRHATEFQAATLPDTCVLALAIPERYREQGSEQKVPMLRLSGDYWEVWFENEKAVLKNSIGLRYLSLLLAHPGRNMHVIDMQLAEATLSGRVKPVMIGVGDAEENGLRVHSRPSGTAGAATDRMAIQDYRTRLDEIMQEKTDSEKAGNPEKLLELNEEERQILQHFRSVLDLHGRYRPSADDDERARQAVTKALKRTIENLWKNHPPLARHLNSNNLEQGLFCLYKPDPPVYWVT